jgi:UDP-N-acetylglucosamine--N-acetylmuramyl-(pentapeptide) pyrophosphoryl-undecaprenol N-acetylglucosamine transferase
MTIRVLIAGGGTGGHVFPMVAVGDALAEEHPEVEVVYVGTGRGIEGRVIPERGDRLETLDVLPLRGGGLAGSLRGVARALAVLPEARALVRRVAPQVVFSVGGYAAGPVTLAAWSLRVPVTLLEPNAVAGFTNRLLAPLSRRAYVCFPEAEGAFGVERTLMSGVPLRRRFEPVPRRSARARAGDGRQPGRQGAQ